MPEKFYFIRAAAVIGLVAAVVAPIWTLVYLIGRQRGSDKPSWAAVFIGAVVGTGIATATAIYITFNFLLFSGVDAGVGLLALLGDAIFGCGLGGSMGALIGVLLADRERSYKK
jgi:hypothetical protein